MLEIEFSADTQNQDVITLTIRAAAAHDDLSAKC